MTRFSTGTFCLLLPVITLLASDPPSEEKTGLKVGAKAPEFKLKDQTGAERTLSALRKDRMVALVFYRSASW